MVPNWHRVMGTKTKLTLLQRLCEQPDRDWSVTELAAATGIDKAQVSRALVDIQQEGFITATHRGQLKLCKLKNNGEAAVLRLLFNRSDRKHMRGVMLCPE